MNETKLECCPECGGTAAIIERETEIDGRKDWSITIGCAKSKAKSKMCQRVTCALRDGLSKDEIRAGVIRTWNNNAQHVARVKAKEKEPLRCPICYCVNKESYEGHLGYSCAIQCKCHNYLNVTANQYGMFGKRLPDEKVEEIALKTWNAHVEFVKQLMNGG